MAKPKLALIPASQGSKLYSVLPSGGVGDFDFTRGTIATRINKDGLIETVESGVSRLNYPMIDGVVKGCPSLLLEPSRTNKFLQSNNFDTSWSLSAGLTLTENSEISPDGNNNAWKLKSDGSSGFLQLNQVVSVTGSNTISIFAKKGTNRYLSLRSLSGIDARAQFDLELGEVYASINSTASIEDYGNGWFRCIMNFNGTNGAHYFYPNIQGTADSGYIYVFGGQIEAGDYATSYIPTTTSPITRSAETANGSGDAATFKDSEGVLMAEISALDESAQDKRITISSGVSQSQRVLISYVDDTVRAFVFTQGALQCDFNITKSLGFSKIALKYKANDFALWIDGIEVDANNIGSSVPSGLNRLSFNDGNGSSNFYGNVKQIQYFDTALSDTDLETLTSWVSFQEMAEGQLYKTY